MHRYNTRFQARKAVQSEVQQPQVQQPQVQQPQIQQLEVPQQQVQASQFSEREEVRVLKEYLDRGMILVGKDNRTKNAIDIFSYLAGHPTLLDHPRFRTVVIHKITELRHNMEVNKKDAIDTFMELYSPHVNTCQDHRRLMEARNVLEYNPQLEVELKKVEAILYM